MGSHSKLIVAIVGLIAIILTDVLNITPDGTTADTLRETLLALFTLFGIERVTNKAT